MDYKKAIRCVVIALMVIVACCGGKDSNNETPKADSNAKKSQGHQQKPVNVKQRSTDRCYDSSRDCWHYEQAQCKAPRAYRGNRSYTIGGFECQSWRKHGKHGYKRNYCRNPDNSAGPWCYAQNAWDYCFSWCNMDSCYDRSRNCFHYGKAGCLKMYTYIGTRSSTINGVMCQPWKPHTVNLAGNLCRDPYGGKHGPYCYIDPQSMAWNYCFADCNDDVCYDSSGICFHYEKERCWKPYAYLGTRDYAKDGTRCDRWINHNADIPKNYCRLRYGGRRGPWCFTEMGTSTWKYCFPDCRVKDFTKGRSCGMYPSKYLCEMKSRALYKSMSKGKSNQAICSHLTGPHYGCVCYLLTGV